MRSLLMIASAFMAISSLGGWECGTATFGQAVYGAIFWAMVCYIIFILGKKKADIGVSTKQRI